MLEGGEQVVPWCNWLALRTLNPAIRVQISVGPLFLSLFLFIRFTTLTQRNTGASVIDMEREASSLSLQRGNPFIDSISYLLSEYLEEWV